MEPNRKGNDDKGDNIKNETQRIQQVGENRMTGDRTVMIVRQLNERKKTEENIRIVIECKKTDRDGSKKIQNKNKCIEGKRENINRRKITGA